MIQVGATVIEFATGNSNYRKNWQTHTKSQLWFVTIPQEPVLWNPIEHRLFSFISLNWAGKPLRSKAQMTALKSGTTTQTATVVKAAQIKGVYPTRIKVSDQQMAALNLTHRSISSGIT
ncbi:MAG: hypothetical protein F6K26_27820 [Moorea sp. SIO2I5]|nr:hypothetical protein [Moorena sp. SIO2I5]